MFFLKAMLGILIAGIFGANVAKQIHDGNLPWWTAIFSSTLGGVVWGWMVSQKKTLFFTSTLYNVLMGTTYIIALLFLGERLTLIQFWGITLTLVGIILVNT